MKEQLIVGDTLEFTTSVDGYPASDGWTLKFRLIPRASGSAISFDAVASGSDYLVQVPPATTATWVAGEYAWASWVQQGSSPATARHEVDRGLVTLIPDPATTNAPYDSRSHARKALDAIEATIEGRATGAQLEYEIGHRRVRYIPHAELLDLRKYYKGEVQSEELAEAALRGQGGGKIVARL